MPESTSSLVISAGLFAVVAIASQIVQNRRRQHERETAAERQRQFEQDLNDGLGHRYSMKRMTFERLSRENLNDLVEQEMKERDAEENVESGDNVYDFQPKNRNWEHFDLSFEIDEEDIRSEIDVNHCGDESSASSSDDEEEFLWTNRSMSIHNSSRRRGSIGLSKSPPKDSEQTPRTSHRKEPSRRTLPQRSFGSESRFESERTQKVSNPKSQTSFGSKSTENGVTEDGWLPWRNVERSQRPLPRQSSAPIPGNVTCRRESYEPQVQNRVARRRYNARIMPNKVVMIRHGQSMGNIDEHLYSTTSDNAMPLTKLGWEQARKAGETLKNQVLPQGETVHFIVSPYVRTVETFHGVVSAWCDPSEFKHIGDRDKRLKAWYGRLLELGLTWHEDPRIREQDFGNYQVRLCVVNSIEMISC